MTHLEPMPINDLMEYQFFIPHYQRGYRWTETQVLSLLKDIWEFNPQKEESFYCLQPIVVKKRNEEPKKDWYEVIDGQQRLTTIFLILKNLEAPLKGQNIKDLAYATREDSETFLRNINEADSNKYIDFKHIYNADKTIKEWFEKFNKDKTFETKLMLKLIDKTRVIFYEVDNKEDAYEIFTRLNIGKISLTNAELIRALFLRKWKEENIATDAFYLKQLQIASEWDQIEKKLQEDSFWYFIYNSSEAEKGKPKYATHIEYIFDLIKEKPSDQETYYTFNEYYEEFEESRKKYRCSRYG
ncbi:DUF262 domain-containing protein [Leadbettera azotonutricia]|uniref:DUF262 domain-containing protein n=1 Tax=Leadbettera azotonutricia TaxID=150829 RepID=UPI0002D983BC|nr:DUF262 domain-containing protein [Leadbettera azotonutricia]